MLSSDDLHRILKFSDFVRVETIDELKKMVADYPFFQLAWMVLLKCLKQQNSDEFDFYLRQGAIRIPDRRRLFLFLQDDKDPDFIVSDEDNFISPGGYRLADPNPDTEEESLSDLVKSIRHKQFIEEEKQPVEKVVQEDEPTTGNEFVTETLARIYINQGLYQQALDAYHKLSLKYPEKNVYFATQVEEIKKLMTK